jgi:hypothetical protein
MLIRSGKVQFLFWAAFFSVMLYLWIIAVGLQTFVLPDETPMHFSQDVIILMFVLYGMLTVCLIAGTIISTMIDNGFYQKFFTYSIIITILTLVVSKSMFG